LKKADGGGPGCTGGVTGSDIFQIDSADGDNGNLNGLANLTETFDALRRAIEGFRRRVKDGTEIDVVRAIASCPER
jgi:hypothetical protein